MQKIMLLHHFTWMQYLETLAVLLVIYYAVVLFKFYLPEVQEKLKSGKPAIAAPLHVLQYEGPAAEEAEDPLVKETETLIAALKQRLQQAPASEPVKNLLRQYPNIRNSALRPAINELIVTEWEKHRVVLLNEAEVDRWWD